MKHLRLLVPIAILFLAGCANFVNDNGESMATTPSQQYAGIFHVEAVVNGAPIQLVSGKEVELIEIEAQFDDAGRLSNLDIAAKDIAAFKGQAISAEAVTRITETIFTELTDAGVEVTRAVVEGAVNAALGL